MVEGKYLWEKPPEGVSTIHEALNLEKHHVGNKTASLPWEFNLYLDGETLTSYNV